MSTSTLLQAPPLSLYIHIPWCVRKCPYCDFNSHEAVPNLDETAYIGALLADLEQELEHVAHSEIQSIFFGGGTPSLFSAKAITDIISGVANKLTLAADTEITLEANPGTAEHGKFSDYRAAGINRLSLGIQSFDDDKLNRLGRIHNRDQAIKAIESARGAGFDNINLDLMFGLPGQIASAAVDDVKLACELEPTHISHYQLTIEPNTLFYKFPPELPELDSCWDMQQRCHDILGQHGYQQYEVSAFARANRQCRHNLNYWTFGDYIGIGAGAHGKSTLVNRGSIQRRRKHRQPLAYIDQVIQGAACSGRRELDPSEIVFEFLLNALRLRDGFSFDLFECRTGIDRRLLINACGAVDPDLLVLSAVGLRTSARGFDFLNDVLEKFLLQESG
ncbi:MAG: radical SAM family heme chaperone HemW [Gammaproteobacteria bacterium]|nr:radical SAM family heme chaperone HemW [Gammaproteobacteria bacterium]NNJ95540.1 radical SAM family heme chaperone HemW [Gammaproteobacteria bacterium]